MTTPDPFVFGPSRTPPSQPRPQIESALSIARDAETDPVEDDEPAPAVGDVERALRESLARIRPTGQLSGALIASSLALAQAMDRARPDKIAAIGKELREHIRQIEESAGADDSERDRTANLSSPV